WRQPHPYRISNSPSCRRTLRRSDARVLLEVRFGIVQRGWKEMGHRGGPFLRDRCRFATASSTFDLRLCRIFICHSLGGKSIEQESAGLARARLGRALFLFNLYLACGCDAPPSASARSLVPLSLLFHGCGRVRRTNGETD